MPTQTRSQILRFGEAKYILGGKDFCQGLKNFFWEKIFGTTKYLGGLHPNASRGYGSASTWSWFFFSLQPCDVKSTSVPSSKSYPTNLIPYVSNVAHELQYLSHAVW